MEDYSETKIWRYMDLAKFVSLLVTESLYFVCPLNFDDPYEGFFPRANLQVLEKASQWAYDSLLAVTNDELGKKSLNTLAHGMQRAAKEKRTVLSYGVNCWHKSEYESEAMWKLYSASGQGIAIESTIGHLKASLADRPGLIVESVQYVDFDKDLAEVKDRLPLFLKRKSFEHEKELRAAIPLPEKGEGTLVKCNLDTLIGRIHISPFAPAYFEAVLENLCAGKLRSLEKPVIPSKMFNVPDYSLKINTQT